jgi:hypothetical protein
MVPKVSRKKHNRPVLKNEVKSFTNERYSFYAGKQMPRAISGLFVGKGFKNGAPP